MIHSFTIENKIYLDRSNNYSYSMRNLNLSSLVLNLSEESVHHLPRLHIHVQTTSKR